MGPGPGRWTVGTPTPALRDTPERSELAALAQREWLAHAVRSCLKSGGGRRLCHDAVLRVLFYMLKSAGFEDGRANAGLQDRWWDEGEAEAKDTRSPDVTAFNPRDTCRRRYVIDVVGGAWAAWAVQPGGGQGSWPKAGHSANGKAQIKT